MLSEKELRSELEAALQAVTPPAPWLSSSIEEAWRASQRRRHRRRFAFRFQISMRVVAAALLIALALSSTAVFLAIHLATTAPATPGHPHATSGFTWGMVSSMVGWEETTWFDPNGWHRILRTTDGGSHWSDVTPPSSITNGLSPSLTQSLGDLGQLPYILDATHLWLVVAPTVQLGPGQCCLAPQGLVTIRTADGGRTWERGSLLSTPVAGEPFTIYFLDASRGWLLTSGDQYGGLYPAGLLFGTTDGGLSWTLVSRQGGGAYPDCQWSQLTFVSPVTGWLWVECPQRVSPTEVTSVTELLATNDGGTTWLKQALPLAAGESPDGPPVAFDPDHAMLLVGNYREARRVLMTSDAGRSWSARTLPGETQPFVDFLDPKHGWTVAGPSSWFLKTLAGIPKVPGVLLPLYRTGDGGKTWSRVPTLATIDSSQGRVTNLYFVDQRNGFLERTSATSLRVILFRTRDGGITWTPIGPMPPR